MVREKKKTKRKKGPPLGGPEPAYGAWIDELGYGSGWPLAYEVLTLPQNHSQ